MMMMMFFCAVAATQTASEILRASRSRAQQLGAEQPHLTDPLAQLNNRFEAVVLHETEKSILKICREECENLGLYYDAKTDECKK